MSKDYSDNNQLFKQKYKIIKRLKKNESSLYGSLLQLTQNQIILENESFTALDSVAPNIEANKRKTQLNKIKADKQCLALKIDQINNQIKDLMDNEEKQSGSIDRKEQMKKFINNIEQDREIVEGRLKKIKTESKLRRIKINKDITRSTQRRIEELDMKEKERILLSKKRLNDIRQKEKELISKRSSHNNESLLQIKEYVNNAPESSRYLYQDKPNTFFEKEKKIIKTECLKRRHNMKPISREDFIQMNQLSIYHQERIRQSNEYKTKEMKELWKERSSLIPKYHSPILNSLIEEENKVNSLKDEKKNEIKALSLMRKNYSYKIFKPHINPNLNKERRNRIMILEGRNYNRRPQTISLDSYNKRIPIIKIRNQIKTARINLECNNNKKQMPFEEYKEPFRPIRYNLNKSIEHKDGAKSSSASSSNAKDFIVNIKENKDYLSKSNSSIKRKPKQEMINWNKMMKENNGCVAYNIENIKMKASLLDEQAQQKQQLLKLNGGINKFPEMGLSLHNILVNSIKAKLAILNCNSN